MLFIGEKIDAIISTSSPVTAHLIAIKLKQKYNIPWVADLRDLWTQNHYINKSLPIRYLEKKLELKTLSSADAIVTVSEPLAKILKNYHQRNKIFCITNGFDIDDFPIPPPKLTDKFTITYTGLLYNGKRDPSMLFKVISQLLKEGLISRKLIDIRFFGCDDEWLHSEVNKYDLNGIVNIHGFKPREEILKIQQESQLLLLLLWDNKYEEGVYTGKVFEYLGAFRPILAFGGPGGVVKHLLETTNAGRFANDTADLKDVLLEYYNEFLKSREVKCRGNNNIHNYGYEHIAEEYSGILNAIAVK